LLSRAIIRAEAASGTLECHGVFGVAEMGGGFAFRQNGAAMVPNGPAVGSVFNNFGGLGRDDRIRYDTPVWESPAAMLYRNRRPEFPVMRQAPELLNSKVP